MTKIDRGHLGHAEGAECHSLRPRKTCPVRSASKAAYFICCVVKLRASQLDIDTWSMNTRKLAQGMQGKGGGGGGARIDTPNPSGVTPQQSYDHGKHCLQSCVGSPVMWCAAGCCPQQHWI